MKYFLLIIVLFISVVVYKNFSPLPTPTQSPNKLAEPITDFKSRITKKFFGTYVTPQNSPVSPEKFRGYHTGVDVEYGDVSSDVPVFSITDGQVIYSGHVNGYGGFVAIQYPQYIGIYGHLKPSSLIANKSAVKEGDTIGILGQTYSTETDGERKHLHFAIIKGQKLDFRGYVQDQSELNAWINPISLYN